MRLRWLVQTLKYDEMLNVHPCGSSSFFATRNELISIDEVDRDLLEPDDLKKKQFLNWHVSSMHLDARTKVLIVVELKEAL